MGKIIAIDEKKHGSVIAELRSLLSRVGLKEAAKANKKVVEKIRGWIYIPKIRDGNAVLSDGTRYAVDGVTGTWTRVFKKGASQRERRRLYGKMRRAAGFTRSQAQRNDIEMSRIGM